VAKNVINTKLFAYSNFLSRALA